MLSNDCKKFFSAHFHYFTSCEIAVHKKNYALIDLAIFKSRQHFSPLQKKNYCFAMPHEIKEQ